MVITAGWKVENVIGTAKGAIERLSKTALPEIFCRKPLMDIVRDSLHAQKVSKGTTRK